MQRRQQLKSRIVISFLLFGTLLSILFAAAVLLLQDYLENQLIGRTLQDQLSQYLADVRQNPGFNEPFYNQIQGYVVNPERPGIVPTPFRELPSGLHDVRVAGSSYKAAVQKDSDIWGFLIYDVSANEELGQRLVAALLLVIAGFSLLSLAIGRWSARRVMKPVTDLAERIEDMNQEGPPQPLAPRFADDEVGQLAAELDDYAARLHHLVERDREFNADVSHELRTPLAVITGATELLLTQDDLPDKVRTRLLRIARAARQSSDITNALLHMVRAERGVAESSEAQDVGAIADSLVHLYEPLIGSKDLDILVEHAGQVSTIAPAPVIAVTLGNLVGNAVRYTPSGEVRIRVGEGKAVVSDTGPGIDEKDLPHIFDRHYRGGEGKASHLGKGSGLGLAIVKRLCDLYGWEIEIENAESGGLRASLHFFADQARV